MGQKTCNASEIANSSKKYVSLITFKFNVRSVTMLLVALIKIRVSLCQVSLAKLIGFKFSARSDKCCSVSLMYLHALPQEVT